VSLKVSHVLQAFYGISTDMDRASYVPSAIVELVESARGSGAKKIVRGAKGV